MRFESDFQHTWERNTFGVYPTPPITPNPPAFVTAAASSGPAATFIPASIMGCWIPNSFVMGVVMIGVLISYFFLRNLERDCWAGDGRERVVVTGTREGQ